MIYAQITGNTFTLGSRPQWFNDEGNLLSDAEMVEHGYLPVIYDTPTYDPQRQTCTQNPTTEWVVGEDSVTATYTLADIPFADIKKAKLAQINAQAQATIDPFTMGYPKFEIDSWPTQENEAAAYALDDTAPTPWCDNAATARGIDRLDFIGRVAAKAALFKALSSTVSGYRQNLEDAIDDIDPESETAIDDLVAIVWVSPLP